MTSLTWIAVLALASYRVTRALTADSITAPIRDGITNWAAGKPTSRPRAALDTLIHCAYCTGWWISGATLATYLLAAGHWHTAPLLVHAVEWAAVAGVQALLNAADNTAGSAQEAMEATAERTWNGRP